MPAGRSLIALLILTLPVSAADLDTLGGKKISGALVSISEKTLTMTTDKGEVATPLSQALLLTIRDVKEPATDTKYTYVQLLDDSVVRCKSVQLQGKNVELALLSGEKLNVPLTFVVSFLRDAQDQKVYRQFAEMSRKRLKRDRIILLREGAINTLEGTLGDVDEKTGTISFRSEVVGTVDLPFTKLYGAIFFRGDAPPENPLCKVFDTEGNVVTALKLAHDGKNLTLTTTLGSKLTLPADSIARIDFNLGKLTYLSDLTPTKVVEKSGVGDVNPYRRDKNLDNQPIVLDGKDYSKGLSMHAHTELEYDLAGRYKTFKATLGIDVRTGADSEPRVTIYCDNVEQFNQVVTIKGVVPIALNVKDVSTLRIVVSGRDFTDLRDHCTLVEARVSQ